MTFALQKNCSMGDCDYFGRCLRIQENCAAAASAKNENAVPPEHRSIAHSPPRVTMSFTDNDEMEDLQDYCP